jgi:hypothetical protein
LCIGLAFSVVLVPVLWVMLGLTSVTAVQRFVKVWRQAPGPVANATPSNAPAARPAQRAARHSSAGTSRWREWREASAQRAAQETPRWRTRGRGPGAARRSLDSSAHSWRRQDRTRP